MNSMILHELFFDGFGDQSAPGSRVADALAKDFGSFERWRAKFIGMGKALAGPPPIASTHEGGEQ